MIERLPRRALRCTSRESAGIARTELIRLPRGLLAVRIAVLSAILLAAVLPASCQQQSADRPEEQIPFQGLDVQDVGVWPMTIQNAPETPDLPTPEDLDPKNEERHEQKNFRRCTPDGCTIAAAVRLRN